MEELLKSVAVYGVPSIIALYAFWWITNKVLKRLDKLDKGQRKIANALVKLVKEQEK